MLPAHAVRRVYVTVDVADSMQKTTTFKGDRNPQWNEEFILWVWRENSSPQDLQKSITRFVGGANAENPHDIFTRCRVGNGHSKCYIYMYM